MTALAQLLTVAFFLGLDSLRTSAGLASAELAGSRPLRLALAFGFCDAAAPLAGLAPDTRSSSRSSRCSTALARSSSPPAPSMSSWPAAAPIAARRATSPAIVGGVPLVLSPDNLIAGAALGVYGFPIVVSALVLGATSALLLLVGSAVGRAVSRRLTARMQFVGAALLVLVALSLAIEEH